MQTLRIILTSFCLTVLSASADERFTPSDWLAGILEKTEVDAVTSFHRANGNLVGISVSKTKCFFLFHTKQRIIEQKLLVKANGREMNFSGKEEALDYEFKRDDSIFNFSLGFEIDMPPGSEKVAFVVRFTSTPGTATRIECDLDREGNVIQTSIRELDAKVEFPHVDESPGEN